jgi:hypothetical protein
VDHLEVRLRSGAVAELWEDSIRDHYPSDFLKIWRHKIIPSHMNALPQCDKNMRATYILMKYIALIDDELAARGE